MKQTPVNNQIVMVYDGKPWCGIADRVGFKGDILERDCIHSLAPEETFEFTYSISIDN